MDAAALDLHPQSVGTEPASVVLRDARDAGRAVRVTWHHDAHCVVLSVWRGRVCVSTVRLAPAEAERLAEALRVGVPARV